MKDDLTQFQIRLPESVYSVLSDDAVRCRRSVTKQVEAILVHYYDIDSVELNGDIEKTRTMVSPKLNSIQQTLIAPTSMPTYTENSHHHSGAGEKRPGKQNSSAVRKDIADIKADAQERIRRKKNGKG